MDRRVKPGDDGLRTMKRLKAHALTVLMAAIFGMLAYGVIHIGLNLHRWIDADSLTNRPSPK